MNVSKRTVTEINLSDEEYKALDEAREVAWEIGRSEEFDSFPEDIQHLVDNIADAIDELIMYFPGND